MNRGMRTVQVQKSTQTKGRSLIKAEEKGISTDKEKATKLIEEVSNSKVTALEQEVVSLKLELKGALKQLKEQNQELDKIKNNQANSESKNNRNGFDSKRPSMSNNRRNSLPSKKEKVKHNVEIEKDSEKVVKDLKEECKKLSQKIGEMERFFSDHGLIFIGEQTEKSNGTIRMTTKAVLPNFNKVLSSIDDLNITANEPQIIQTRSGATFKQCELLNLTLFSDGMVLADNPFREYSTSSVRIFFRDIEDGYYPTELKGAYPNGVIFKVIDKRNQTYNESRGFTGKGQKLGGKEQSTPSHCEEGEKESSKPRKVLMYERKIEITTRKIEAEDKSDEEEEDEEESESYVGSEVESEVEDEGVEECYVKENTGTVVNGNKMNYQNNRVEPEIPIEQPPNNQASKKIPQKKDDFEEIFVNPQPSRHSDFSLNQASLGEPQKTVETAENGKKGKKTATKDREKGGKKTEMKSPVVAISTQTSDILLMNLPTKSGGSSGGTGQRIPYNITNINYREGPININVTPETLPLIRDEICALRAPKKETKPEIDEEAKARQKQEEARARKKQDELKVKQKYEEAFKQKKLAAQTEYSDKFNVAIIEEYLRAGQQQDVEGEALDTTVRYKNIIFLGAPPFEEEEGEWFGEGDEGENELKDENDY